MLVPAVVLVTGALILAHFHLLTMVAKSCRFQQQQCKQHNAVPAATSCCCCMVRAYTIVKSTPTSRCHLLLLGLHKRHALDMTHVKFWLQA